MSKKSTKIIAAAGVVAGLGVAALPALTFAEGEPSVSGQVTLSAQVQSAIAMTIRGNGDGNTDGVDVFDPAGIAGKAVDGYTIPAQAVTGPSSSTVSLLPNAADTTTATSAVTVYTNASGYTLSLQDADEDNSLVKTTGVTIPAGTTIQAGTSAWGFKAGSDENWREVPDNTETAASITPAASGTAINVVYGISTASTQATGTYTDTIVYTATANE